MRYVTDIAFTPTVKALQERLGSREIYANVEENHPWSSTVDARLRAFVQERDGFYLGTATAHGRPYIQYRGGPKGFLKVLDDKTLAFADFGGNKQYLSAGNLAENDQAFIFLMDYANQARLKLWGRAEVVENDPELLARVADPGYKGRPERVIVFHLEMYDGNCPKHIRPRYTEEELEARTQPLRERIQELEAQLAEARNG